MSGFWVFQARLMADRVPAPLWHRMHYAGCPGSLKPYCLQMAGIWEIWTCRAIGPEY